ncbi:ATP-binding protein [Clostridium sp. MSJ-11]|uniref:ATP-binding protein n=1 Tax=Clostridium mobile TaxID=2841512 RepID=A0ABS6EFZ7_9CLOT|nr:ATP-binding protein [Clostridium mobile]MBU5484141.1 ATP-binding protein [Clostridium mobile]
MNKISATIGKFALDSLTIGMYENEMVLYREYIQNSTDAIDRAIHLGLIKSNEEAKIDIRVKKEDNLIKITDNGCGIAKDEVISKLCDIGNSDKDYYTNRGFRGIGRLAGTAYCEKLIFTTSFKGEDLKSILIWDCKKLKQLLKPGENKELDLKQVIEACVEITYQYESEEKHYFQVRLEGVQPESNLLYTDKVKDYLSEVAPIEMDSRTFYYYSDLNVGIKKYMRENKIPIEEYPIELNGKKLTKLYSTKIKDKDGNKIDDIININKEIIKDNYGNNIAFLWYGERKICKGQIYDDKVAGLRYRKNNIMVGDCNTISKLFGDSEAQKRFNKYYIGEVYIIDKSIIPNARRDDFEESDSYKIIKENLTCYSKNLIKLAREMSNMNNAEKKLNENEKEVEKILNKLKNSNLNKSKKEELKEEVDKLEKEINKNKKKIENSSVKLSELGRKDVANKSQSANIAEIRGKVGHTINLLNNDENKRKRRQSDPLLGKPKEIKNIVRGILEILEQDLDEKKYMELEVKIYNFVNNKKR